MKKIVFVIWILIASTTMPVMAKEWTGIVVGISDGDTLNLLNSQKNRFISGLLKIDAPESKQAVGFKMVFKIHY